MKMFLIVFIIIVFRVKAFFAVCLYDLTAYILVSLFIRGEIDALTAGLGFLVVALFVHVSVLILHSLFERAIESESFGDVLIIVFYTSVFVYIVCWLVAYVS